MPKAKPKKPEFLITTRASDGSQRSFNIKANDIEEAAAIACRRVSIRKSSPRRTSGKAGEPGWFYPQTTDPKWPFGGNAYKVEPEVSE